MMNFSFAAHSVLLGSCCLAFAHAASAATITTNNSVAATSVIYAAGTQSALASSVGGTTPTAITLAAGSSYFTFSVPKVGGATQTLTLNGGGNYNDADGNLSAVGGTSSNSGYGSISGITAPGAGYLVGVFLPAGGPTGTAPAALSYSAATTSFTSATPLLDQVFFIGDGLTGDGTGSTQTFYVPTGATTLYLGISDAGGYNGGPGSYGDNSGSFSNVVANDVTTSVAVTPEPSSLLLLGTGALSMVGLVRRRIAAAL